MLLHCNAPLTTIFSEYSRGTSVFLHHLVDYIRAPSAHWAHYSPFGPDSHIIARRTRPLRGFRNACYPTPSFAGLRLRNRRRGLRRRRLNFRLSSLAFVFAFGVLVFAFVHSKLEVLRSLSLPSGQKTLLLHPNCARGLRSIAEGGAPNT